MAGVRACNPPRETVSFLPLPLRERARVRGYKTAQAILSPLLPLGSLRWSSAKA